MTTDQQNLKNDRSSSSRPTQQRQRKSFLRRFVAAFFSAVFVFYLLFIIDAPFYIYKPGTAEDVQPMVQIKEGAKPHKGTFMLTTVGMSYANWMNYLLAMVNPYAETQRKEDVLGGRTEAEFSQRQEYVMAASQSNAIQAAYSKAGVPFRIDTTGVIVLETLAGMPAEKVLQPGDYIVAADNKEIRSSKDLLAFVNVKKPGDRVSISYRRNGVVHKQSITLGELPQPVGQGPSESGPRAGIGVAPADVLAVKAADGNKQVTVKAGEIGGPSAGLMFALEIYNQLTAEDISKGYRIAGTGTINPKGKVCPIGGVRHKIVAADRAGAEIFFVPKDMEPPECGFASPTFNASNALKQAQEINSQMRIVPVATMDDALQFLAKLPPKAS